jgi:hypothetical protein
VIAAVGATATVDEVRTTTRTLKGTIFVTVAHAFLQVMKEEAMAEMIEEVEVVEDTEAAVAAIMVLLATMVEEGTMEITEVATVVVAAMVMEAATVIEEEEVAEVATLLVATIVAVGVMEPEEAAITVAVTEEEAITVVVMEPEEAAITVVVTEEVVVGQAVAVAGEEDVVIHRTYRALHPYCRTSFSQMSPKDSSSSYIPWIARMQGATRLIAGTGASFYLVPASGMGSSEICQRERRLI